MNRGTSMMLSFTGQKEMLRKAANWMTGKSIITANSAWLAEVFSPASRLQIYHGKNLVLR